MTQLMELILMVVIEQNGVGFGGGFNGNNINNPSAKDPDKRYGIRTSESIENGGLLNEVAIIDSYGSNRPLYKGPIMASPFYVPNATIDDFPGAYIEANVALTKGGLGFDVRFLGAKVGLNGNIGKSEHAQIGFEMNTKSGFKNTSVMNPYFKKTYGGGISFGAGIAVQVDGNHNTISEITTSAVIIEYVRKYNTQGNYIGDLKEERVGINIGAGASIFAGAEFSFKAGIILPKRY